MPRFQRYVLGPIVAAAVIVAYILDVIFNRDRAPSGYGHG